MTSPPSRDHPITQYLPLVIAGDLEDLVAIFAGEPVIADPRFGQVPNTSAAGQFMALERQWMAARQARVEPVALTLAGNCAVYECLLHLQPASPGGPAEPIALPVAMAADLVKRRDDDPGTGPIAALRVYHSLWPLLGAHQVRPPLLPARRGAELKDAVAQYHQALSRGDVEGVLGAFEPEGCAREPSGGRYRHCGAEGLRQFYGHILGRGGIKLDHCNVADDGVRCALEYNAVRWGDQDLPPQAGLAVYERGESGRLRAARIYDDIEPPVG